MAYDINAVLANKTSRRLSGNDTECSYEYYEADEEIKRKLLELKLKVIDGTATQADKDMLALIK